MTTQALSVEWLNKIDACWRAVTYLADNLLLKRPLIHRRCETHVVLTLGHDLRTEFYLCAPAQGYQATSCRY
jgi:hypothetical protein